MQIVSNYYQFMISYYMQKIAESKAANNDHRN